MATPELSEEEVFSNDKDPLEAIMELRREEGKEPSPELEQRVEAGETLTTVLETDEEEILDLERTEQPNKEETDHGEERLPDPEQQEKLSETETEKEVKDQGDEEELELEKKEEKPSSVTKKFKANGREFEFTQEEINEQFEGVFGKAMDYTQKMQKIAPYRKMISALESEGITQEQLNVAIDALKGDKGALASLMKEHDMDAYDLTDAANLEENPYTPKDYGKSDHQLAIEEVTSQIQNDQEFNITVDVVDNQWDAESRQVLASNPNMLLGLHNDIKSGVFDKVAPLAMKMKVLDRNTRSSLDYYMLAAEQLQLQEQNTTAQKNVDQLNQKAKNAEDQFDKESSEANRKRSATSTGARADRKGVVDYLDDDDEKFDAWYESLMRNS